MKKGCITEERAQEELLRRMAMITREDVIWVSFKSGDIMDYFDRDIFKEFHSDLRLMISLINDYRMGIYNDVPWILIAAIAAAILYMFSPLDSISDFEDHVVKMDSLAVLDVCIKLVKKELMKYEKGKNSGYFG